MSYSRPSKSVANGLLFIFGILGLSSLVGCAATAGGVGSSDYWEPSQIWFTTLSDTPRTLRRRSGSAVYLVPAHVRNVYEVKSQISETARFEFVLGIIDRPDVNAFAFVRDGQHRIALTLGFIERYGLDKDIIASTLGHEIAHHVLNHTDGRRQEREQNTKATAQITGSIMNQIIPFSGYIASYAVMGIGRSYSRVEEIEADKQGFLIALKAGYDPCAGLGMLRDINVNHSNDLFKEFLSSHPANPARIRAIEEMFERDFSRRCN